MHVRAAILALASCAEPGPGPQPPKAPNISLIIGDFERHPPQGETAIRFETGGTLRVAKNRAELEHTPHLADGTWKLDGDQLELSYAKGICSEAANQRGLYKVVISKIGVHFTRVEDSCDRRTAMDGQTWWRVK